MRFILRIDQFKMKQLKRSKSHSKRKSEIIHDKKEQNYEQRKVKALSFRQIRQNYSTLPSKQVVLQHSKQVIINKFSQQFLNKFDMDYAANEAISAYDQSKLKRLAAVQAQIVKINQFNSVRLEELTKMEKTFIKRIQQQIKKDKQLEQKLKKEHQKLVKEEEKIVITKGVRALREKEYWVAIQKQQRKIELMAKVLQKRHLIMGRDKSHDFKKPEKKQKEDVNRSVDNNISHKKQRKKRSADQLKQMGRQFLEHAKKVQADNLKSSTKLLDVYKKSIDYLPQMNVMLKSNAQDLSKPIQSPDLGLKSKRKKGIVSNQK